MVQIGDIVKFGKYYQTSKEQKDDIERIILDVKDDSVLLLSKFILDAKPYNDKLVNVTWRTCTLRRWLNKYFLNEAFNTKEIENILDTTVKTPGNRSPLRLNIYGILSSHGDMVTGGKNTTDKIFILSWGEAIKYFKEDPDSEEKIQIAEAIVAPYHPKNINNVARVLSGIAAKGTKFAIDNNLSCVGNQTIIWFRSPGNTEQMAVTNIENDILYHPGCEVNEKTNGVRPALWVKKEVFLTDDECKELEKIRKEKQMPPKFLKAKNAFDFLMLKDFNKAENIFKEILYEDKHYSLANFGMACIENYKQVDQTKILYYLEQTRKFSEKLTDVEKECLTKNINFKSHLNNTDNGGIPLLITAICCKAYAVVKFLLANGADPNLKTTQGRQGTPFFCWVQCGTGNEDALRIGELLMDYGADVHAITKDGFTIFGNKETGYGNNYQTSVAFEMMVRGKYKEITEKRWINHPEEKEFLNEKKSVLLQEINNIKKDMKSDEEAINNLLEELSNKQMQKDKILIFNRKERKEIHSEIKIIKSKYSRACEIYRYNVSQIYQPKIKVNENKINQINLILDGKIKL